MPWMTPQRSTPITHSHVDSGISHESPPPPTPALLQTTWTPPKPRDRGVGERLHLRGVGHVGDDAIDLGTGVAQLVDRDIERVLLDVTDDDPHALGGEPAGERRGRSRSRRP